MLFRVAFSAIKAITARFPVPQVAPHSTDSWRPVRCCHEGYTLAINPSAKHVFTAPMDANHVAGTTIAVYQVNPTTGAPTPLPNDTLDTEVLPISLAAVAPPH